jgi:hypothetical protein
MLDLYPVNTEQGAVVRETWLRTKKEIQLWKTTAQNPILVHQMGKVGSTSVMQTISSQAGLSRPIQTHYLSENLPGVARFHVDAGIFPLPVHLYHSWHIRNWLKSGGGQSCKVISLVRDPIARQVSNFFQNPGFFAGLKKLASGDIDAEEASVLINQKLHRPGFFDEIFKWFDAEFKAVFGLDVMTPPFDRDAGFMTSRNGLCETLVLQLEQLASNGISAVGRFLKIDEPLQLVSRNRRARSRLGDTYQTVLDSVKIEETILDHVYTHPFVTHFYNDAQIKGFRQRWSGD